jgi:hypothetical protein
LTAVRVLLVTFSRVCPVSPDFLPFNALAANAVSGVTNAMLPAHRVDTVERIVVLGRARFNRSQAI